MYVAAWVAFDVVSAKIKRCRSLDRGRTRVTVGVLGISVEVRVRRRMQCRLGSSAKRTPNAESVHQAAKGVRVKIKNGSGAVWSADHPACSL